MFHTRGYQRADRAGGFYRSVELGDERKIRLWSWTVASMNNSVTRCWI